MGGRREVGDQGTRKERRRERRRGAAAGGGPFMACCRPQHAEGPPLSKEQGQPMARGSSVAAAAAALESGQRGARCRPATLG